MNVYRWHRAFAEWTLVCVASAEFARRVYATLRDDEPDVLYALSDTEPPPPEPAR